MRFNELLDQVASLWPEAIDISDGKLLGASGGIFPSLSRAWAAAEQEAEKLSEFHSLTVWAIYGALHERARHIFNERMFELRLSECSVSEIERRLSETLQSPTAGFEHLRDQYVNDLRAN